MTTATPSPAAALKAHLTKTKTVTVQDVDGTAWTFVIKHVPLMTWDPDNGWFEAARKSKTEDLAQKIAAAIAAPTQAALRLVLLKGVVRPAIAEEAGAEAVAVDDLLRRDLLTLNLYQAIAEFSCEGLFKVEGASNGGTPP